MYLLTYERRNGSFVKLVFDSHKEAQAWGVVYSTENNTADTYDGSEYTISSYPKTPKLFTYTGRA
jgi:hypothetical protein